MGARSKTGGLERMLGVKRRAVADLWGRMRGIL